MGSLVINRRRYRFPDSWAELSWEQWQAVRSYADTTDAERDEASVQILTTVCSVGRKRAIKTEAGDRDRFVRRLESKIRIGMSREKGESAPEKTGGRECRGAKTTRPDTIIRHFRQPIGWLFRCKRPLRRRRAESLIGPVTAVELCEATDLYLLGGWEYAPLIAAILGRVGKAYREEKVRRKAEKMRKLTMGEIFIMFEDMKNLHRLLRERYPLCYANAVQDHEIEESSSWTWNDLLLWAAHHTPGEIERTQQLGCGDFMALVQSRIRTRS